MVFGHCGMILGQGGVVWVTQSGQEDSGDLFESWAAIRETPGAEHRLPGQIVGKWFWERNFLKSNFSARQVLGSGCLGRATLVERPYTILVRIHRA